MVELTIIGQVDGKLIFRHRCDGFFSLISYEDGEARIEYDSDVPVTGFIEAVEDFFRIEGVEQVTMIYENSPVTIKKEDAIYDNLIKVFHYQKCNEILFRENVTKKIWEFWKNDPNYIHSVIFAEYWAIEMQKEIENGKSVCDIAIPTSEKVKEYYKVKNSLFVATVALGMFWKYGDDIIKWQRENPEIFGGELIKIS